jgi:hypothetical protein
VAIVITLCKGTALRVLYFDQFEFNSFSSEEILEIHIGAKHSQGITKFTDVIAFAQDSQARRVNHNPGDATHVGSPRPYVDTASYSSIRQYLKRFADLDVPDPCDWLVYVMYEDDLEWDGILETPTHFIRYHWESTA